MENNKDLRVELMKCDIKITNYVADLESELETLRAECEQALKQEPVATLICGGWDNFVHLCAHDWARLNKLGGGTKLYTRPLPVQPSPAVEVNSEALRLLEELHHVAVKEKVIPARLDRDIDKLLYGEVRTNNLSTPTPPSAEQKEWNAQCTCGHRWLVDSPTERCPVCSSVEHPDSAAQRITEQDAREIAKSYALYCMAEARGDAAAFADWFGSPNGRRLLAKLNEHREPDYKAPNDIPSEWRVTRFGQVKAGDVLSLVCGDSHICTTAKEILNAGTNREEVIYNRKKNHYFITSMVLDGTSTHKHVFIVPNPAIAQCEGKGDAND